MHGMRVKSHKGQTAAQTNVNNNNQFTPGSAPKAYWEGLKPVPTPGLAPVNTGGMATPNTPGKHPKHKHGKKPKK